jgi:hypothetical protein
MTVLLQFYYNCPDYIDNSFTMILQLPRMINNDITIILQLPASHSQQFYNVITIA